MNARIVYAYSRSQAVADGVQVEVTKTAHEAGIKFPVFITRGVFELCVAVPPNVSCQDEAGRLWDVVGCCDSRSFVRSRTCSGFPVRSTFVTPTPSARAL